MKRKSTKINVLTQHSYNELYKNEKSFYLMFHEAVVNPDTMRNVLTIAGEFCREHKIKVKVDVDGTFIVVGKNSPEANYIIQSLNNLYIDEYYAELSNFLSGNPDIDTKMLAVKLCAFYKAGTNARILSIRKDFDMIRDIDLQIRQNYAVISNSETTFSWNLFRQQYTQKIMNHIKDALKEAAALYAPEDFLTDGTPNYDMDKPMSAKLIKLLAYQELATRLKITVPIAINKYHISFIDSRIATSNYSNYQIEMLELLADIHHNNAPGFFIIRNNNSWILIGVMPDKAKEIYLVSINSSANDQKLTALSIQFSEAFLSFVQTHNVLKLRVKDTIFLTKHQQLYSTHGFVIAMNIADMTLFYENAKKQEKISWEVFMDQPKTVGLKGVNGEKAHLIEMVQNRFSRLLHTGKEINILSSTEKEQTIKLQKAPGTLDPKTNAAQIILEIIKNYKPNVYDFFGYDFSGKRTKLIDEIINIAEDTEIWEIYGDELNKLKVARSHGRLYQDLFFGVFIDKIIEDSKLPRRSIARQVHNTIIKLAKASEAEYEEYKKELAAQNVLELSEPMRIELVSSFYNTLKQYKTGSLENKLLNVLNTWIADRNQILNTITNSTQKNLLQCELLRILIEWRDIIAKAATITSFTKRVTLPKEITIKNLQVEKLGEFISTVCYQKAQGSKEEVRTPQEQEDNAQILSKYYEYLDALPEVIRNIHQNYVAIKKERLHATKLLKIILDYKTPVLKPSNTRKSLFSRLLASLHDPVVYNIFASALNGVVIEEHDKDLGITRYIWSDKPDNLLRNPQFGTFIATVFRMAGINPEEVKLHKKIQKALSLSQR